MSCGEGFWAGSVGAPEKALVGKVHIPGDGAVLALCESAAPMLLSAADRFVDIVGILD